MGRRLTKADKPPTPELDKLHKVAEVSQKVGEFVEWTREQGWTICSPHEHDDACWDPKSGFKRCGYKEDDFVPISITGGWTTEKLLAKFFGIDLKKADAERDAILEFIRRKR